MKTANVAISLKSYFCGCIIKPSSRPFKWIYQSDMIEIILRRISKSIVWFLLLTNSTMLEDKKDVKACAIASFYFLKFRGL